LKDQGNFFGKNSAIFSLTVPYYLFNNTIFSYLNIAIEDFYEPFDYTLDTVCIHVESGSRYIFLIEATKSNLEKFNEYTENNEFFGSQVNKCTCVNLNAGQTFVIPAGWICKF
jgi:hypothetical protein